MQPVRPGETIRFECGDCLRHYDGLRHRRKKEFHHHRIQSVTNRDLSVGKRGLQPRNPGRKFLAQFSGFLAD